MTWAVSTYWKAFLHRKVQPLQWQLMGLSRLRRIVERQLDMLTPAANSPQSFIERLRPGARRFFFGPENRKEFFLHLLEQSQDRQSIISDADDTSKNIFQALGSDRISLGESIDWQRDFISGHSWPLKRLTRREILDLGNPSDIKVPWELGRFHQVWWLGKGYWVTHDEAYAQSFARLVIDWIRHNPPGKGVHWAISMESAIRACNWICGFLFFVDSPSLYDEFWRTFAQSLFTHGVFIWHNREFSLRNGNHYLSNIVGLLLLGLFFRETTHGKRWLAWSLRELEREMENQVTDDGVDYEKSTCYHRLVTELFAVAAIICRTNAFSLTPRFWSRLEKMFDFMNQYSRDDGSVPHVGDADDGRLFRLQMDENFNDHRDLLSVGAVLFSRQSFKSASGSYSQTALFLLGGEGFERFLKIEQHDRAPSSSYFPSGGYVFLRSPAVHIMADVGDLGMRGRGGHGHNDTLSFELWAYGESLIIDRGTYTYTRNRDTRRQYRSTRAHNTIMIDEMEIAEFSGLWSVTEDRTRPNVLECSLSSDRDLVVAEHSGYERLPDPVVHRRSFDFLKTDKLLLITDELLGSRSHTMELRYHLDPKVKCSPLSPRSWTLDGIRAQATIEFEADAVVENSWFSPSYGVQVPIVVLVVRQRIDLPARIVTSIRVLPKVH